MIKLIVNFPKILWVHCACALYLPVSGLIIEQAEGQAFPNHLLEVSWSVELKKLMGPFVSSIRLWLGLDEEQYFDR